MSTGFKKVFKAVGTICASIIASAEVYYRVTESTRQTLLSKPLRERVAYGLPNQNFDFDDCLLCANIIECGFAADNVSETTIQQAKENLSVLGFESPSFFYNPDSNAHGFVVTNKDICIVAFRGSKETRDFQNDSKIGMIRIHDDGAEVHEGFHECCLSIQDQAVAFIQRANPNKLPIVICGHSLGGANALLCGYMASMAQYEDVENKLPEFKIKAIYTYGQPRVGNSIFGHHIKNHCQLHDRIFRVVNKSDAIPGLPPQTIGYVHCGNELYFDEWNIPHWNYTFYDRLPNLSHQFRMRLIRGRFSFIDDHMMIRYVEALQDLPVPKADIR